MSNRLFFTELQNFYNFLDRLKGDNSQSAVEQALVAFKLNFVDQVNAQSNKNPDILHPVRLDNKIKKTEIILSVFKHLQNANANQFANRLEIFLLLVRANQRLFVAQTKGKYVKDLAFQITKRIAGTNEEYYAIDFLVDETDQWAHVAQRKVVEPTPSFAILMSQLEKNITKLEELGL